MYSVSLDDASQQPAKLSSVMSGSQSRSFSSNSGVVDTFAV